MIDMHGCVLYVYEYSAWYGWFKGGRSSYVYD